MEIPRAPELHPAHLPPGTRVGAWWVVKLEGRGTYGAVMEWVEGVSLYQWAREHNPSSRQALWRVAQVARALEATHGEQGVHRDVKGENILVRQGDGRAVLVDLGAGHYAGASTLTGSALPPGTPRYRSPEAWQFVLRLGRRSTAHYAAGPADDMFALGVTAYRLVTDEYPPSTDPAEEEAGLWHVAGVGPRPPLALNPRVHPQLSALILRMLSVRPEARGRAGEVAEALEQAARSAGPEADEPLFEWETLERSAWPTEEAAAASALGLGHRPRRRAPEVVRAAEQREVARAEAARREAEALAQAVAPTERAEEPRAEVPAWLSKPAWAAVSLMVAVGVWWWGNVLGEWMEGPRVFHAQAGEAGTEDGGTVGLGDAELAASVMMTVPAPHENGIRLDMPPRPFKGQRRPPCGKGEVEIRGGCWVELRARPPDCEEYAYKWEGGCYYPVGAPPRPSTSDAP